MGVAEIHRYKQYHSEHTAAWQQQQEI